MTHNMKLLEADLVIIRRSAYSLQILKWYKPTVIDILFSSFNVYHCRAILCASTWDCMLPSGWVWTCEEGKACHKLDLSVLSLLIINHELSMLDAGSAWGTAVNRREDLRDLYLGKNIVPHFSPHHISNVALSAD